MHAWVSNSYYYTSFLYCLTVHLLLALFQVQHELGKYAESKELLPIIEGVRNSEGKVHTCIRMY